MNEASRRFVVPVAISSGLYSLFFFGFPTGPVAVRPPPAALRIEADRIIVPAALPPREDIDQPGDSKEPKEATPVPRAPDSPSAHPPHHLDFPIQFVAYIPPYDGPPLDRLPPVVGNTGPGNGQGRGVLIDVELDNHPRATVQPQPVYPHDLKRDGIEGRVVVEFTVEKDGTVSSARVVQSTHAGFDEASLQAVRHWRFEPGLKEGRKVRFRMAQPLVFNIRT